MAYRKEKDYSLGHAVAGIVDMKTALNPNINKTQYKYYYTILPSDHDEKDYDIIESGTYAGKNHFEIESMIYDESLIDETTESDPANYITQISIKIKEVKGSD